MNADVKDFLLKEMGLIQECFNKYDDWIIRVRTSLIVGLSALASLPVIGHAKFQLCTLLLSGALLAVAAYCAEGMVRTELWFGYVKRKEQIEKYLNGEESEIRLYVVKSPDKGCPGERAGRCWCKRDMIFFNLGALVVFFAVFWFLGGIQWPHAI